MSKRKVKRSAIFIIGIISFFIIYFISFKAFSGLGHKEGSKPVSTEEKVDSRSLLSQFKSKNKILKISTFKVSNTGKKIGTANLEIAYKMAIEVKASIIYITVYPKYKEFIKFLENNGFTLHKKVSDDSLKKGKSECDEELVLIKDVC